MLEVKNICANNLFGMKFFEIYLVDKEGYRNSINVNLSTLKELNVTKSMNGFKKVRAWAESEEGQKFLLSQEDALASKYESWGIKRMKKEWEITYEIFPLRALYTENVVANTQEDAIDFLETIKRQKIRIIKVEEVTS